MDWAAVRLPVSYVYLYHHYIGGARGRRPGQVTTVGRQKNRRVSGGRRTHTDQLHLFLLRAKGQTEEIRDELALVLDEDAQTMVVKLWRVLLFHAAKAAQRPSA